MKTAALWTALVLLPLPAWGKPPKKTASRAEELLIIPPKAARPQVVLAPRPTVDATLIVMFRAGSADDGPRRGLTRLTQHLLIEANKQIAHADLLQDLYAANATLELETEPRRSTLVLTAPATEFEPLARSVLSACFQPELQPAGLEKARRRAGHDRREPWGRAALAAHVASRISQDPFFQNPLYGEERALAELTLLEVQAHVKERMSPANASVFVAGRFDQKRAATFITRFSGGKRRPAERSAALFGQFPIRQAARLQLLAQPIELSEPRAIAASQILSRLVEARLVDRLRKKGLSHRATVDPIHREWLDFFLYVLPVGSAPPEAVRAEIQAVFTSLQEAPIAADELEPHRRAVLEAHHLADGRSEILARLLLEGEGDLTWQGPEVRAALESLSAAELTEAARPWLDLKRSLHLILGPS